jgi:hypothetical protein
MHALTTIKQIEENNRLARKIAAIHADGARIAVDRAARIAPGFVGKTGEGTYYAQIKGKSKSGFDTYREAEAWVIEQKITLDL